MRKTKVISTIASISFAAMSFSSIAADEKKVVLDGAELGAPSTCNVENLVKPKEGWIVGGDNELAKALKLKPDSENGMDVYEVCAACHLDTGWGREDGTFPQLAGQHRRVLIKQLADIRAKNRDNLTMYPFTLERAIGGPQSVSDVTAYIE